MIHGRLRLRNRISSQIAAVIIVGMILLHGALVAMFFISRDERRSPPDEVVTLIRLLAATPTHERPELLARAGELFATYELALASPDIPADWNAPPPAFLRLPAGLAATVLEPPPDGRVRIAVRLPDGEVVTARLAPPSPHLSGPFTVALPATAVLITLLGLWAAQALTRPLRAFAEAAESFRPDDDIAPLAERGPEEVRAAAAALNRMRVRIKALMEDRTRLLAAVGHDLRTPITRLRLRCAFVRDEALRFAMLRDLAQMQAMAESILDHLRAGRGGRAHIAIDLASLLQTVCDEFADLGRDVVYEGPAHTTISADADGLRRAFANLVDNAVRYGGGAVVRLTESALAVTIDVVDRGPGIPDNQKADMMEPFVRGETARSMDDTAGFGLGLSVARATILAHGGNLNLLDNEPSGLVARLVLPRRPSPGLRSASPRSLP